MAIYRITRTSQPNLAPNPGALVPGQLAVEMATQPNPRLWVGVPTNIDATGRRLIMPATGGGGGGGIPDAPTDGQIYGRDGETQTWVSVLPLTGGTLSGMLVLNGNATAAMDALPLEQVGSFLGFVIGATPPANPVIGTLWLNSATGALMAYNGTAWVTSTGFLNLEGGSMVGNLILDGPPSEGGNPNQAATRGFVDSKITGAVQFIGTFNASTGFVSYTTSSGLVSGAFVNPATVKDSYVICQTSGTMPAGSPYLAGITFNVGDWAISDGAQWYQISVSGEEQLAINVAVSPTILGADNVQGALEQLFTNFGLYAPIASPGLQGIPTTPSPPIGDYSLQIANTEWVQAAIQKAIQGSTTGDLDAILLIGNLSGSNLVYQGTGQFFDDLTLSGDSAGTSGSTSPNFISSVQFTNDTTGT